MLTSENFILMACYEFEKVNLTIINIQRITHAFDRTFVNLINQIFVGRMQMLEGLTPVGTSIGREGEREEGREGEKGRGGEGEGEGEGEMEFERLYMKPPIIYISGQTSLKTKALKYD